MSSRVTPAEPLLPGDPDGFGLPGRFSEGAAHGGDLTAAAAPDQGEVRRLLAEMDWSDSPLGPPESWPQSLRTALSICLSSRFPILLWWGPELVMIYNDAYRPMLGANKHPGALGAPGILVWPEIWDVIGPMLDQVMSAQGATWSRDQLLVLDRNGYLEECYFTFSYSPITDESGGVGGVFCAVTETTERVLSERRLTTLAAMAELAGAADRRELLSRASAVLGANHRDHPVAVVVDVDDPMQEIDPSQRRLVRDLVSQVHRTGRAAQRPADPGTADGDSPVLVWHALPVREPGSERCAAVIVVGEGGQRKWDDALASYVRLCATHVANALGGIRQLQAERERTQALAELDEAKSAWITNISHELRTPLTLIAGPVHEALSNELPEDQRQRLSIVERNTVRLTRMVDAMLDFGRMEAGRLLPHPTPVDVTQLTAGIAESFRPALERAGLRFLSHLDEVPTPAHLDRDMYERVVLNLLSNALKYTPDGTVTLRLTARDGGFDVSVTDTGIGIHERDLGRVFERFEQLPRGAAARSHEGAGIGLAMVKQLTELMGGTVEVRSAEGRGSTFTVHFQHGTPGARRTPDAPSITPRRADAFLADARSWEDAYAVQSEPAAKAPAASRRADRPRLLVVDDNADMRTYLRDVLADAYDVELSPDGRAALEAARRQPPDLVLADVMMPGLDGYELVARMRGDGSLASVPVVLVSARAGDTATRRGLEAGADDYLVKPFSVVELRARLASNLERARARLRDASWRRAVMGSLHEALVITNLEGRVLEVNDAFTELLGWALDEGPLKPPYPWWPRDPTSRSWRLDAMRALAAQDGDGVQHDELEFVRRDGRPVWASVRVRKVDGLGEQPPIVLVSLRDVTRERNSRERRAAAAALSAEFRTAQDLSDVLTAAVLGFGRLFDGSATVRVASATREHLFTAAGPVSAQDLPAEASALLRSERPAPSGAQRLSGVLLTAGSPEPECHVWVQFDRPRRVSTDERIAGDLLARSFALACDRVMAASEFADREDNLQRALESHRTIGQAVGILVERHRCTPAQAFEMLRKASQDRNTKLRDVAEHLVETGTDPDDLDAPSGAFRP